MIQSNRLIHLSNGKEASLEESTLSLIPSKITCLWVVNSDKILKLLCSSLKT